MSNLDPIVLLSLSLYSLLAAGSLVGLTLILVNLSAVLRYVSRAVVQRYVSRAVVQLSYTPWLILQHCARMIATTLRWKLYVLGLLAVLAWSGGVHAQTLPIGDSVSDQYASPIGSLADMGSLFAAVFIVGGFAVGHTLDKRDAQKRVSVLPHSKKLSDSKQRDRWPELVSTFDHTNKQWPVQYAQLLDVRTNPSLQDEIANWENEGGAL